MKQMGVEANRAFAETYLMAVLRTTKIGSVKQAEQHLRTQPANRLAAATEALSEFKHADLEMSKVCSFLEEALRPLAA